MKKEKIMFFLNKHKVLICFLSFLGISHFVYADLENSLETLQNTVLKISIPIAVIGLVISGWAKMQGNDKLFQGALIATIIIFAAPLIVKLIAGVF